MKIDREYPATHSMSTAWYIVDDEGNIGIVQYEDNGPVPWCIPTDCYAEELLTGFDMDYYEGLSPRLDIELRKEQKGRFIYEECPNIEMDYDDDNYDPSLMYIPYYLYTQCYSPNKLLKKVSNPLYPVKIDQVPLCLRDSIHKIPGKFSEIEKFQIAAYHPTCVNCVPEVKYGANRYALLPLSDTEEAYMLTDILDYDFFEYCPKREEYGCENCDLSSSYRKRVECQYYNVRTKIINPTIVIIENPVVYESSDLEHIYDSLNIRSIFVPIVHKVPSIERIWDKRDEILKMIPSVFKESYSYFEKIISHLRPRAIILMNNCRNIFTQVYKVKNHLVLIDNIEYPIYFEDEVDMHRKTIEELSLLPYRGEEHRMVIPKEEMNALLARGEAY